MSARGLGQIAPAIVVGVACGLYIWKPVFDSALQAAQADAKRNEATKATKPPSEAS